MDKWSDPRDESKYSEHDILSLGFLTSPKTAALLENTPSLDELDPADYDAIFLAGGQGPMYIFYDNQKLYSFVASFYAAGKVTAVVCHATCW